ncbi:monosaccharide ABC transporter ATP-binding protein, CUT2 family [Tistlia consotensis]|uniref:Monosaccharide ABC transporter ATP-binding protein, CUT2 family n=1 Tax=Tistlia consotensis USBA 355 TaxID=560819 RepID=A0A1Y6CQB2_9PROT|nr:ATP-binding cassette domain-containing protein [Tistlia consotensis]SMF81338.1 monosaccharide ABC transporter ATP-binding protein, CUT2 family [Tistlia consotensis USBA 355]SNS22866.1 monosaccharide ABC transporter ATP-binding protein, CUT2 family [Tistlia consotensis]
MAEGPTPLVEMRGIEVAFGGVKAVDGVSLDLYAGEVVGLLGHNGAGKSTLIKVLSGAVPARAGEILIDGAAVRIASPQDARRHRIETIYQTLALADNLNAAANLFLGRELTTPTGLLDEERMEAETRRILARLNRNFDRFSTPVRSLSGGQRQSIAIARAVHFDARILIMDEPTAALGVQETAMVAELVRQLKAEGIGIFLISHDIHDVFDLSDRVTVLKNGRLVGTRRVAETTQDEVLAMIIQGEPPSSSRHPREGGDP